MYLCKELLGNKVGTGHGEGEEDGLRPRLQILPKCLILQSKGEEHWVVTEKKEVKERLQAWEINKERKIPWTYDFINELLKPFLSMSTLLYTERLQMVNSQRTIFGTIGSIWEGINRSQQSAHINFWLQMHRYIFMLPMLMRGGSGA